MKSSCPCILCAADSHNKSFRVVFIIIKTEWIYYMQFMVAGGSRRRSCFLLISSLFPKLLKLPKIGQKLARVHQMDIWLIISQFRYIENTARTFLSTLKAVCCILVAIICIFICFFSVSCFSELITHCAEYAINFNLAAYLQAVLPASQRATMKECVLVAFVLETLWRLRRSF